MTIELTPTETACGVTVAAVRAVRAVSLVYGDGTRVAMPSDTGAALAGAVARYALGAPASFAGFNALGHVVHVRDAS